MIKNIRRIVLLIITLVMISSCSSGSLSNVSNNYKKGYIEGNTYTNESLNIKFIPNDNMYLYQEDEMNDYYKGMDSFYEEISDFYKKYDKKSIKINYELLVRNNTNGSTLGIATVNKFVPDMSIESYKDLIIEQICSAEDYDVVYSSDLEDSNLYGVDYKSFTVTLSIPNKSYSKTFLYSFFDDKIVQISIDCLFDDDFYNYINCFKPITNQAQ